MHVEQLSSVRFLRLILSYSVFVYYFLNHFRLSPSFIIRFFFHLRIYLLLLYCLLPILVINSSKATTDLYSIFDTSTFSKVLGRNDCRIGSSKENEPDRKFTGKKFQLTDQNRCRIKMVSRVHRTTRTEKSVSIGLSCITSRPFRSIIKRQRESNSSSCLSS